jgi:hypothetical protein
LLFAVDIPAHLGFIDLGVAAERATDVEEVVAFAGKSLKIGRKKIRVF